MENLYIASQFSKKKTFCGFGVKTEFCGFDEKLWYSVLVENSNFAILAKTNNFRGCWKTWFSVLVGKIWVCFFGKKFNFEGKSWFCGLTKICSLTVLAYKNNLAAFAKIDFAILAKTISDFILMSRQLDYFIFFCEKLIL